MDNISTSTAPWYVVRGGREGSRIYHSWQEVQYHSKSREGNTIHWLNRVSQVGSNVQGQPSASVHVFPSLAVAEEWLHKQEVSPSVQEGQGQLGGTNSTQSTDDFSESSSDSESDEFDEQDPLRTPSLEILQLSNQDMPYNPGAQLSTPVPEPEVEEPQIQLSFEQRQVLNIAKSGRSIFFTGAAGTGKSVLLREIIRWGRSHYGTDQVAVTAPTGVAANNIGGGTIYSWAGIELGKATPRAHFAIIRNSSMAVDQNGRKFLIPGSPLDRWQKCRMLILDEISMVDGRLLDKLEWLARHIKKNHDRLWGGLQLIVCGDFYQLPPISQKADGRKIFATFAFEASSWHYTVGAPIVLTKVFRQKDAEFIDMLNAMRVDKMSPTHIAKFLELQRPVVCPNGIKPTLLFPRREQVLNANMKELAELPGVEERYIARDLPGVDERTKEPFPPKIVASALEDMVALEIVSLKEGAQVMLIKNLVAGSLINGSLGKVVGFLGGLEAYEQRIDFGLPQCLNERYDVVTKTMKRQDPPQWLISSGRRWPLVEFTRSRRRILCVPLDFEASDAYGVVEATRQQIPLILAWAMSIHKSQGQTIDYVSVDVEHCFESGQVYVAMSRARSREGLQVVGFDPRKVRADERVKKYMGTQLYPDAIGQDDVDRVLDFWGTHMNT